MASSRSQTSKGVEKRKRDKAEQDEVSQKKRRQGKADKQETASTPSRNGDATDSVENGSVTNRGGLESRLNGNSFETKILQRWTMSEPMGGRMSDVDPIFSADEK